jgi:L-alanine-DL-glutamate epimerase-like enolase superfamily enzyme
MNRDVAVRAIRAAAYTVPTDAPESDGTFSWDSTTLVTVELDAGGSTGLGYTYADASVVPLVTGMLAEIIAGRDCLDVRTAWRALVGRVRNVGATGLAALAISAVDAALWDLKARLLDVPLAVLLDAAHATVPVYGSGGFTSYDDVQLTDQLRDWVDQGIPRVKMKVGREPGCDRSRAAVARNAVGDETELYVDANGALPVRAAIEWAHIYRSEFDVSWFEEPVTSDDVDGLREVRAGAPGGIDIAAGEYCWNPWDARRLLAGRAVDCLQLDVTRCLGITGFLAAAGAAGADNIDVSAHCAPQLSAHVCTAVRRLRHLEYFHDHVRIERELFDGVLLPEEGGVLRPDRDRPGHGLALKRADAERFRVA